MAILLGCDGIDLEYPTKHVLQGVTLGVNEGDRIGIGDQGILAVGATAEETALASLKELVDDDSELITIYAGGSVSEEEAGQLAQLVKQQFQAVEVDLQQGDQPVYDYLLSIE